MKPLIVTLLVIMSSLTIALGLPAGRVAAGTVCGGGVDNKGNAIQGVTVSIDLGCKGSGNPITDLIFAVIRFLSDGVGLVVIGSIIWGGIQYSVSRGNPQATAQAIARIRGAVIALFIFIFGYAILNYLIPAGFIHP